MTNEEAIRAAVTFVLTHVEKYSDQQTDGAVKLTPESKKWISIVPDADGNGGLFEDWAPKRDARIAIWTDLALAELLPKATV